MRKSIFFLSIFVILLVLSSSVSALTVKGSKTTPVVYLKTFFTQLLSLFGIETQTQKYCCDFEGGYICTDISSCERTGGIPYQTTCENDNECIITTTTIVTTKTTTTTVQPYCCLWEDAYVCISPTLCTKTGGTPLGTKCTTENDCLITTTIYPAPTTTTISPVPTTTVVTTTVYPAPTTTTIPTTTVQPYCCLWEDAYVCISPTLCTKTGGTPLGTKCTTENDCLITTTIYPAPTTTTISPVPTTTVVTTTVYPAPTTTTIPTTTVQPYCCLWEGSYVCTNPNFCTKTGGTNIGTKCDSEKDCIVTTTVYPAPTISTTPKTTTTTIQSYCCQWEDAYVCTKVSFCTKTGGVPIQTKCNNDIDCIPRVPTTTVYSAPTIPPPKGIFTNNQDCCSLLIKKWWKCDDGLCIPCVAGGVGCSYCAPSEVCGNDVCDSGENCKTCIADCPCPDVCAPSSVEANKMGCVNKKPTDYCVDTCAGRYTPLLCRLGCGIACSLGFCRTTY